MSNEEASTPTARGESRGLLSSISNEIVRAQKQYYGRGPSQAKSYIMDDVLLVVMRGGLTVAEQTMLDFGEHDAVREFRQRFENGMAETLIAAVERLTDRKVVTYQSQILFDPVRIIEIFFFDMPGPDAGVYATAEGQLRQDNTGEATDDAALNSEAAAPE